MFVLHGQVRWKWAGLKCVKSYHGMAFLSVHGPWRVHSSPPSSSPSLLRATRSAHKQSAWWRRPPRQPAWHRWSGCSGTWRHSCTSWTGWTGCWPWSLKLQGEHPKRRNPKSGTESSPWAFVGLVREGGDSPERASPLCRTSSMLATMILCTSCSSVLMLPRFLRARLSIYDFFIFWM